MNTRILIFGIIILTLNVMEAQNNQDKLPYYEIPEYSKDYNQGTVVARMVDGLGFRYYWATEGLRAEDLEFKPNDDARTTEETIDHILGLTNVIVNSTLNKTNSKTDYSGYTFEQKRKLTLENLKTAADILRSSNDLTKFKIIFDRNGEKVEYPFWNQINGPIEDAIWHCGQVVSFRRSSGNPYNSKASVFTGKVRN